MSDYPRLLRTFIVCAGALWLSSAIAQTYPAKPIRIVAPFPAGGTPSEFAAFLRTEYDKWGRVVAASGLRPE